MRDHERIECGRMQFTTDTRQTWQEMAGRTSGHRLEGYQTAASASGVERVDGLSCAIDSGEELFELANHRQFCVSHSRGQIGDLESIPVRFGGEGDQSNRLMTIG